MKYAVFSVSLPTYEPSIAVERVAASGYDGIEWRVMDQGPSGGANTFWTTIRHPASPPWSRRPEMARHHDTRRAGDHRAWHLCQKRPTRRDRVRHAWCPAHGCPATACFRPAYDGVAPFSPIWEKAREDYRVAAGLAEKYNVKALLELHHRTIAPSASSAVRLLDGLDPAHIGVIHDIGNMA